MDDRDKLRFIHDLFEFNNEHPAPNIYYKLLSQFQSYEVGLRKSEEVGTRELIVEILTFCLMPNHFHLLLKQEREGGITRFMRKLGTGYTNYFNQKYKRSGSLFEGKFKAVLIDKEPHFIYLPYYIHLNPLDLINSDWKKKGVKESERSIEFLKSYRWSSHLDYAGEKNFPSVTQREFLLSFFGSEKEYEKGVIEWLEEIDLRKIDKIRIED